MIKSLMYINSILIENIEQYIKCYVYSPLTIIQLNHINVKNEVPQ